MSKLHASFLKETNKNIHTAKDHIKAILWESSKSSIIDHTAYTLSIQYTCDTAACPGNVKSGFDSIL